MLRAPLRASFEDPSCREDSAVLGSSRMREVLPFVSALLCALSVSAGACSESLPGELTAPATQRFESRPANTTCLAAPLPPGRVRPEPAFTSFVKPLGMVDHPERGLVYVAEFAGRVKAVERATGKTTTALDVVGKVRAQGLLGFAMHPHKPYVYVTVDREADAKTLPDFPFRSEVICFTSNDGGCTYDPLSEATANQLSVLSNIAYIDRTFDPAAEARMPGVMSGAPLEDRARGYLHANCSFCHRPSGGTGLTFDLRYNVPRAGNPGCAVSHVPGVDAKLLAPGDPDQSAIVLRMGRRDDYQMPRRQLKSSG